MSGAQKAHKKTKNGKGRTKGKHEKGLTRKLMDMKHSEKGDSVRRNRKDPKKRKGLWLLGLLGHDDEEYEKNYLWLRRYL